MVSSIFFIIFSVFVSIQCQIFAPYPRSPAVMPGCPCANPAPVPVMNYQLPLPAPATVPVPVAKSPLGCLEPSVTRVGTIAEVPVPVGLPNPLSNPFLPVASPVSAMAPFSPFLPPANTCSRCQYLKKIPIPPPCI